MNLEKIMKKLKGKSAEIAVFCGSGLHGLIALENIEKVSYKDMGFEYAEISGHDRFLEFGEFQGKKVVIASRFHYYEDGSPNDMYWLHKVLQKLGVKTIIATTAVGAINESYEAGDIVLVKDHINMSGTNPFVGKLPIEFVDMTNAYDVGLRELVKKIAKSLRIRIHEGTHIQSIGPSYETPAEVKFFRIIGGDTVSMSLVHGNICANHLGMKFVAFASITNKASTEKSAPITHEEVLKNSLLVTEKLGKIIAKLIEKI